MGFRHLTQNPPLSARPSWWSTTIDLAELTQDGFTRNFTSKNRKEQPRGKTYRCHREKSILLSYQIWPDLPVRRISYYSPGLVIVLPSHTVMSVGFRVLGKSKKLSPLTFFSSVHPDLSLIVISILFRRSRSIPPWALSSPLSLSSSLM